MDIFEDYYEILQVHPSAEPEIIEAAYRKLAQKYHPDVSKNPADLEKMKRINIAHGILANPEHRRQYHIKWLQRKGRTATEFLIQLRLQGEAKQYAKALILDVARKFKVQGVTQTRPVPHITLYGPSIISDIEMVVSKVIAVGRKYTLVPFKMKGFGYFDKPGKVIYLAITPSAVLERLRQELYQMLKTVSVPQPSDMEMPFKFHSTIAFKDIDEKFDKLWRYIKSKREPDICQDLLRITILDKRKRMILYEYDLVLGLLLSRNEALSRGVRQETISKHRTLRGLQF